MDSKEEFQYEVPIIYTDLVLKHVAHTAKDNDCCIVEDSESQEIPNNKPNTSSKSVCNENKFTMTATEQSNNEPTSYTFNNSQDNDSTVIASSNLHNNINTHNLIFYDVIYKENKLLLELIEKCLDLENSQGMLRIFDRTLIPIYKDADDLYKQSAEFKKVLLQQIMKLDTQPERKFSHIKEICEILKLNKNKHVTKKRATLITLPKNLQGKKEKSKIIHRVSPAKRKKCSNFDSKEDVVISSDSDTDVEISGVIEPHVQILDSDSDSDVIAINDEQDYSNKENNETNAQHKFPQLSKPMENEQLNIKTNVHEGIGNPNKIFNSGELLEPQSHEIVDLNVSHQAAITDIERQIGAYQNLIEQLDEQEVTHDSNYSPYVQSEIYKAKIVVLYKGLCELLGAEPVKRHEVRLQVADGHPEGPVKCLEEFINDNIDEHGNPPFPDMHDVTLCVCKANYIHNLNWDSKQIVEEAKALFIHYGRAIQKRRQNREWRDLMKYVKEELPDPADEDPVLQARLAENYKIGRRKEQELLNRYAEMENPNSINDYALSVSIENDDSAENSDYESTSPIPNVSNIESVTNNLNANNAQGITLNSYVKSCNGNLTSDISLYVESEHNCNNKKVDRQSINNVVNIEDKVEPIFEISEQNYINNNKSDRESDNIEAVEPITEISEHNCINNKKVVRESVNNIVNIEEVVEPITEMSEHNCIDNNKVVRESVNIEKDIEPITEMSEYNCIINNKVVRESVNNVVNIEENVEPLTEVLSSDSGVNQAILKGLDNIEASLDVQNSSPVKRICSYHKIAAEKSTINNLNNPENLDNNKLETDSIIVKKEPEDIPRMLEELGDNFTATIIDIEDPFLVIEISDSSESEDEGIE